MEESPGAVIEPTLIEPLSNNVAATGAWRNFLHFYYTFVMAPKPKNDQTTQHFLFPILVYLHVYSVLLLFHYFDVGSIEN